MEGPGLRAGKGPLRAPRRSQGYPPGSERLGKYRCQVEKPEPGQMESRPDLWEMDLVTGPSSNQTSRAGVAAGEPQGPSMG